MYSSVILFFIWTEFASNLTFNTESVYAAPNFDVRSEVIQFLMISGVNSLSVYT